MSYESSYTWLHPVFGALIVSEPDSRQCEKVWCSECGGAQIMPALK